MSKVKELLTLTDKLTLEDKAALLRERFRDKPDFTISAAASILQEKQSTLYWSLHKLAHNGYIARIGQGIYSFQNREAKAIQPILSRLASRILDVLRESGHDFFISGLDILTVFMDHVPNSRKLTNRCVVGKEIINGRNGRWIRSLGNCASRKVPI